MKPLFAFASDLPQYARRTAALSPDAAAVRNALANAEEPATLLFRQLPQALASMRSRATTSQAQVGSNGLSRGFGLPSTSLGTSIRDLLRRMLADIHAAFERPGSPEEARSAFSAAAERVLVSISEPRLKALCLRLPDRSLPERNGSNQSAACSALSHQLSGLTQT